MNGTMSKWLIPVVVASLLTIDATQAHATRLNPGDRLLAKDIDNLGVAGNLQTLEDTGVQKFTTIGGDTGTYRELVIAGDKNNPFPGGLDFVYQFSNDSTSKNPLRGLSGLGFSGFDTDVSQPLGLLTVAATSVVRSSPDNGGYSVNWNFRSNGQGTLAPGKTSDVLVVRTNATSSKFAVGSILIESSGNGGFALKSGYVPTTPEPSSLVLLGGCLAGLGGANIWRRWRKGTLAVS